LHQCIRCNIIKVVRTTLDIDDDVLAAARELAERQKSTAGRVLSDLARQALTRQADTTLIPRNGFRVLPARGGIVTSDLVRRLSDDES
jgi:hypothetical protein